MTQIAIKMKASSLVTPPSTDSITAKNRAVISAPSTMKNAPGINRQKVQKKGIMPSSKTSCVFVDPMLLAIAISPCPRTEDTIPLTISGRSDPIDETMNPILKADTPSTLAERTSFSTICH